MIYHMGGMLNEMDSSTVFFVNLHHTVLLYVDIWSVRCTNGDCSKETASRGDSRYVNVFLLVSY